MNMTDSNNIDTSSIPDKEPLRQMYFLACCKNILSQKSQELGRDLKMFVQTFGCQMNEHDSEKLSGMLIKMGYKKAS